MPSDAEIFLCEKNVNDDIGRGETMQCEKFPLNQDNFCNGVLDFPPYESWRFKKGFFSQYYLADCNVTAKYEKYTSRYRYSKYTAENEQQKTEEEWLEIKNQSNYFNGYKNSKFYKTWIFFVDELNCDPFDQIMETSLKINFVISTSLGIFSFVVFFGLLKQAKSTVSQM